MKTNESMSHNLPRLLIIEEIYSHKDKIHIKDMSLQAWPNYEFTITLRSFDPDLTKLFMAITDRF